MQAGDGDEWEAEGREKRERREEKNSRWLLRHPIARAPYIESTYRQLVLPPAGRREKDRREE